MRYASLSDGCSCKFYWRISQWYLVSGFAQDFHDVIDVARLVLAVENWRSMWHEIASGQFRVSEGLSVAQKAKLLCARSQEHFSILF
jgi:hypothetical protein